MLISDSIGIDSNTTTYQPSTGSQRVLGKEDFLRLLATQLTYQNPLEPMADTEFIAQLAEFSALEQMQNVNANLEAIALLTQSLNNTFATSLVGKEVKTAGNALPLSDSGEVPVAYTLAENAQVTVKIYDANNSLVRTIKSGSQPKGENKILWDGNDEHGARLPEGEYHYEVEATDTNGSPVNVNTYTVGRVRGVKFVDGVAILIVNGREVSLAEVVEVLA